MLQIYVGELRSEVGQVSFMKKYFDLSKAHKYLLEYLIVQVFFIK